MYSRDELKENLKKGIVLVEFEKTDGTIREMYASLNSTFLPEPEPVDTENPKPARKKSEDPNLIVAYDVKNNGWRSFKYDRLKKADVYYDLAP